ncbi:MAG TPA: SRPBCC family protein [Steroidobacteraceae bacterium]|nr:SRPBCC family protein [Steroidobacteraceae bacterium]
MAEVTTTETLAAPADAVWRLLADFGAIERWWPKDSPVPIESVRIEGDGIGMVRHIQNAGVPQPVSERLDYLDPSSRTLVLSIIGKRPPGITAYVAEGRVEQLDATACRMHYRALVTTEPGLEESVRKGLLKTWARMFRGLEAAARQG